MLCRVLAAYSVPVHPIYIAPYTSGEERRSACCNDLSYISVCSSREQALRSVDELDRLNISDDGVNLLRWPSSSPYVAGPHNASHKVSPRSHIRHLLDQADLAHFSFFTTTGFFSESMEELRGGDTLWPRLVPWSSDHLILLGDFQKSLVNPGLSAELSPCRYYLVDNLRGGNIIHLLRLGQRPMTMVRLWIVMISHGFLLEMQDKSYGTFISETITWTRIRCFPCNESARCIYTCINLIFICTEFSAQMTYTMRNWKQKFVTGIFWHSDSSLIGYIFIYSLNPSPTSTAYVPR